ncbi:hypothetical protein NC661_04545 [Aquibacillus koreensis]|uniref:Uncharacterized protein n=1 Tax=Aquibacillus koreensis TaxID=279446 RepID=A0A9X4AIS3_9BACI|nr:hypothetical protein [Aquibacillus koreensis]MCT2534757.1 hypothetical protein [Aquibacillus koreensis]MDC3419633.1 hypothetical protein [Aquibacillus koreensis]
MDQYKFNRHDSNLIVNAIVEGYRDYIEHRKERQRHMAISSAFAWTKGNFIESKIAEIGGELNFTYKKAKAGLTWDYLQFIHGDKNQLFLIKNAAYFNEKCFSQALLPTTNKGQIRSYLHELSKINKDLTFENATPQEENSTEKSEQLSFFISERQVRNDLQDFQAAYDEFHILTYKIDDAYQIAEIMHYLPNPEDNIAYKIEDLSEYISGAELSDEERDVIAPDQDNDIIDPAAFDIGIFEEAEEK